MNFKRFADACKHRMKVDLDWEGRITEYQCTFSDTSEIDEKYCDKNGEWKEPWGKNQTAWLREVHKYYEKRNRKCCKKKCPILGD